MLLEERLGGEGAEVIESGAQRRVVPVPPGERVHTLADCARKAPFDRPGRNAANDRIGLNGARDDCACANRCSVADANPRRDRCAMADPYVVADRHGVLAPPIENTLVTFGVRPVVVGAVGEMMHRRTPYGM